MKKRVENSSKRLVKIFLFTFLVLTAFSLVQAQEDLTAQTEDQKVDNAYLCLDDRIGSCSDLSTEEKAFSLLATGDCASELIDDSSNDECWSSSSGGCSLKTTSQAILALNNAGRNTDLAQDWLISQNKSPPELVWYLQIESSEPTSCSIQYSGFSHSINLKEDKTLEGNPGPGLSIEDNGYWLEVNPSFYGVDFEVSCNQNFLTNLLFKQSLSSTIHVSPTSSSAAPGGITTETVKSSCLEEDGICNYEGSLWAAFVLNSFGKDVSSYMPYLITLAEDNQNLLPEAFLYSITSNQNYRISLLSKQIGNQRWEVSGDRYYDTALALYPFQSETLEEKTNSKEWLLDVQDADGCWAGGNIRNTAFILESIWPRGASSGDSNFVDCEDSGNYCVSFGQCEGQVLSEPVCSGAISSVCCSQPLELQTCSELGGDICSSNEICRQGQSSDASGLDSGEVCCVGGFCEQADEPEVSDCESQAGVCRISECQTGEESAPYQCSFAGDNCCVVTSMPGTGAGGSLTWIWILIVLIVLVIVGIIFRDKLRHFWLRIKSKFGGGKSKGSKGQGPRPPGPPYSPYPRKPFPGRRILPRRARPRPKSGHKGRPQKSGVNKELDDVLKKLKDMGGS